MTEYNREELRAVCSTVCNQYFVELLVLLDGFLDADKTSIDYRELELDRIAKAKILKTRMKAIVTGSMPAQSFLRLLTIVTAEEIVEMAKGGKLI